MNQIRTRMLFLLIIFTLIPAGVTGTIASVLGRRDGLQRVQDNLSAVATLKEDQVRKWNRDLQIILEDEIIRDTETRRLTVLLSSEPDSSIFRTVSQDQARAFSYLMASRGYFDEIFLLNPQGQVILSTREQQVGSSQVFREYFRQGLEGTFTQPPTYDLTLGYTTVIVATPLRDENDQVIGVIAGRANLNELNRLMGERTGLGQTGETYLVDYNLVLQTQTRKGEYIVGEYTMRTEGAQQGAVNQQNDTGLYLNYSAEPVVGAYRYVPELRVALLAEQTQAEALSGVRATTNAIVAATFGVTLLALAVALFASENLARPLRELTDTAQRIAGGDLDLRARILRQDETGTLALAFNAMTDRLRQLIGSLEERVAERTSQLQARTEQLQAASEVGRSVATILDTDQLIHQVVELIQQRFDLYYVGLFMADENREWAELKAGTGSAGQAMLGRGHRLRIGGASMIGWCVANAQPRIALQAGEDPIRLATPDLPETRSEAAIPLRSRGQVLGALTVQSAVPNAFDQPAIAIFQTMADQVAVALDNARLFAQAQQALEAVQEAYGQLSQQAWLQRLRQRPLGFRRDSRGTVALSLTARGQLSERLHSDDLTTDGLTAESQQVERRTLRLPIQVRGQTIGYLNAQKPQNAEGDLAAIPSEEHSLSSGDTPTEWQTREVNLLENLVDQLGIMLDAARLFEETQMTAQRERLVGEITGLMRATLDLDNVLQTAAREMLSALNLAEVEVRLVPPAPQPSSRHSEQLHTNRSEAPTPE